MSIRDAIRFQHLVPKSQEDLTSWVEALAVSIGHTKQVADRSESNTREEEKKPEIQLAKEQLVQRTSDSSDQCVTLPRDECGASRLPQQPHMTGEIGPSGMEPRPLNSFAKSKVGWDLGDSPQEVQCTTSLLKQALRKADKENRDVRRPCSGKGSTNRQSRAMVYLENALDEMEVIVGSIITTRRLGGAHQFDTFDNRRYKAGGLSPIRSSWDFDWRKREEQSWKGKGAYTDMKRREREQFVSLGQATKAGHIDVPKSNAWKQPALQTNKDWQSGRAANSRSRESETTQIRHSVDGIANLNRNRDLPGLPKYTSFQQDEAQGRRTYSGLGLQSSGRPSTASAGTSSKVQLSPATENLLKRCSGEVSAAETNSLRRSLQVGTISCIHPRDADSRQIFNQQSNLQQQRTTDSSNYPYIAATSSSSEDEEDEEEDDIEEDGEGNDNCSRSTSRLAGTANSRDSALLDGFYSTQDGDNDLDQHSQSRRPSTDLTFCKGGTSLDRKGLLIGTKYDSQGDGRHHNQVWQDATSKNITRQPLGCSTSNQFYGASDDAKPKNSDVLMEPTTPKVREESHSSQTFASSIKASDRSTLKDPIYDPDFTGPQIINRRRIRLTQQNFDGNADVRKSIDNVSFQSSLLNNHTPSFVDTAETHHTSKFSRNQLLSNVDGDETKLFYRGQQGTDFSAQCNDIFPSLYKRQQTDVLRQTESSGSSVSSQQGKPLPPNQGWLSHTNELPELVNRISKITAAIDSRDQQGYQTSHEGAVNVVDRGRGESAAFNMQVTGQDAIVDPYQLDGKGSSLPGPGLARGTQQSFSNDPINCNGLEGHMKWSSTAKLTRDAYHSSQRQSNS